MSQWFYQMLGEEFGPVSAESLQQLVEDGMLDASDLVRPVDSTHWRPVDQSNLIDSSEATTDAASTDDSTDVLTDLADLNFRFEESGGGPKRSRLPDANAAPSKITQLQETPPAPLWFHQFFGQVLGPIPLLELVQMAESGNLSETDSVRCGIDGAWQPAGDVPELAAGFILSSGGQTGRGPQASAPQGRSLFAAAAAQAEKVKAQADAQRAAVAAAAKAAAAAAAAAAAKQQTDTAASEIAADGTPPASTPASNGRSAAAAGGTGRRMGKKAEEKLVDNILSEVFAEPAPSNGSGTQTSGSAGETSPSPTRGVAASSGNSAATVTAAGGAVVAVASVPAPVQRPAFTAPANSSTPTPAFRPAPSPVKSTAGKSSGGGFSVPGGSGIVVAVLVLAAVAWFSYGPINRMLTVDEGKYIRRMEESLAMLEKLASQTDQNELYKVQDEMYREFNDYIKAMHGAGATTGSSKKCLAALGRFTEIIRIDPKRNPELRQKLLADAKQMISDWKAN
jgi:hypothetical protein